MSKKRQLICPCGAATAGPDTSSVGEVMKATGWNPALCDDGSLVWLCPETFAKAADAARSLIEIVGNEYVNVRSLLAGRR